MTHVVNGMYAIARSLIDIHTWVYDSRLTRDVLLYFISKKKAHLRHGQLPALNVSKSDCGLRHSDLARQDVRFGNPHWQAQPAQRATSKSSGIPRRTLTHSDDTQHPSVLSFVYRGRLLHRRTQQKCLTAKSRSRRPRATRSCPRMSPRRLAPPSSSTSGATRMSRSGISP